MSFLSGMESGILLTVCLQVMSVGTLNLRAEVLDLDYLSVVLLQGSWQCLEERVSQKAGTLESL